MCELYGMWITVDPWTTQRVVVLTSAPSPHWPHPHSQKLLCNFTCISVTLFLYRRTIQKDLNDLDNHNGVITHLEPDILECEVKWALGSITMNKASGGDGIQVEPFQILKDDAVKVHSVYQQIWKTAVATGLEKVSFNSNPKEGWCQKMFKLPHNCTHFTCLQRNAQNPSS